MYQLIKTPEIVASLAAITPRNVQTSVITVENIAFQASVEDYVVYVYDLNTGKIVFAIDYDSYTGNILEHLSKTIYDYIQIYVERHWNSVDMVIIYHDELVVSVVPFADEVQTVVKPQEFQSIHGYEYPCVVEWFEDDGCTRFELFNTKYDAYDLVHFLNSVDRKPLKVFVFSHRQYHSMMYPILRQRGFQSKQRIVSFIVPKLNQTHAGLKMEVNVSYA